MNGGSKNAANFYTEAYYSSGLRIALGFKFLLTILKIGSRPNFMGTSVKILYIDKTSILRHPGTQTLIVAIP